MALVERLGELFVEAGDDAGRHGLAAQVPQRVGVQRLAVALPRQFLEPHVQQLAQHAGARLRRRILHGTHTHTGNLTFFLLEQKSVVGLGLKRINFFLDSFHLWTTFGQILMKGPHASSLATPADNEKNPSQILAKILQRT